MAPPCGPGLPMLDVPLATAGGTLEPGTALKPIAAVAGQELTLPVRIRKSDPDRPLLSFMIYLLPRGTDVNERAKAVSESPVLQLSPGQERVSPVLLLPAKLTPGSYDIVGQATFPSPSVCGVPNPVDSKEVGRIWGVMGSIVLS